MIVTLTTGADDPTLATATVSVGTHAETFDAEADGVPADGVSFGVYVPSSIKGQADRSPSSRRRPQAGNCNGQTGSGQVDIATVGETYGPIPIALSPSTTACTGSGGATGTGGRQCDRRQRRGRDQRRGGRQRHRWACRLGRQRRSRRVDRHRRRRRPRGCRGNWRQRRTRGRARHGRHRRQRRDGRRQRHTEGHLRLLRVRPLHERNLQGELHRAARRSTAPRSRPRTQAWPSPAARTAGPRSGRSRTERWSPRGTCCRAGLTVW